MCAQVLNIPIGQTLRCVTSIRATRSGDAPLSCVVGGRDLRTLAVMKPQVQWAIGGFDLHLDG